MPGMGSWPHGHGSQIRNLGRWAGLFRRTGRQQGRPRGGHGGGAGERRAGAARVRFPVQGDPIVRGAGPMALSATRLEASISENHLRLLGPVMLGQIH